VQQQDPLLNRVLALGGVIDDRRAVVARAQRSEVDWIDEDREQLG
jgi:hypothetical protein